jgi:hypothetical protein
LFIGGKLNKKGERKTEKKEKGKIRIKGNLKVKGSNMNKWDKNKGKELRQWN